MSNKGMSEYMYEYILNNIHRLKSVDMDKGLLHTKRGTNGCVGSSTGYLRVKLGSKTIPAHQILAVCYFGKECIGLQVNHKDGNKLNNTRENLEVVTQKENIKHQWDTGLCSSNGGIGKKLTSDDVKFIRSNHVKNKKGGENSTSFLADKFKVSASAIDQVVKRVTYVEV